MKVSIITICYNSAESIERTLMSVIDQRYNNLEYIIIDGGSTDGTLDILDKYKDHLDYVVSEPDNGISDAFNKGISIATGEIIGIINSDDWLEKNIIGTIIDYFPQYDLVYGNINYWISRNSFKVKNGNHNLLIQSWRGMCIPHPSLFVKKEVYEDIGKFDERYKNAMDYDFVLRAFLAKYKFINSNVVISNFSKGGVTSSNMRNMLSEEREIKSKLLNKSDLILRIEEVLKFCYLYVIK